MFGMFKDALADFDGTERAVFALVMFVIVFAGAVVWTYRRSARKHYEYMARLPLDRRDSE